MQQYTLKRQSEQGSEEELNHFPYSSILFLAAPDEVADDQTENGPFKTF